MDRLNSEEIFKAIAHPIRRAILIRLTDGEKNASDLAVPHKVSFAAISQQLSVLKESGLISERRDGRSRIYQLHPEGLKPVIDWIDYFEKMWVEKLNNLGNFLDKKHGKKLRKRRIHVKASY
jgi:DNA-binding transcriptional ArsR family regulator